jgi:hypothetical protein
MHAPIMPPPTLPPVARQLALPLAATTGPPVLSEVGPRLRPQAVWRTLPGTLRMQVRLTVQRILEEVIADADAG